MRPVFLRIWSAHGHVGLQSRCCEWIIRYVHVRLGYKSMQALQSISYNQSTLNSTSARTETCENLNGDVVVESINYTYCLSSPSIRAVDCRTTSLAATTSQLRPTAKNAWKSRLARPHSFSLLILMTLCEVLFMRLGSVLNARGLFVPRTDSFNAHPTRTAADHQHLVE